MEISDNRNLSEFFGNRAGNETRNSRTLVIMDEVDGMGGGDRGGNQELIALIKKTRVPVICICNDRQKSRFGFLVFRWHHVSHPLKKV